MMSVWIVESVAGPDEPDAVEEVATERFSFVHPVSKNKIRRINFVIPTEVGIQGLNFNLSKIIGLDSGIRRNDG